MTVKNSQIEIERKWLLENVTNEVEHSITKTYKTIVLHQYYLDNNKRFRVIININNDDNHSTKLTEIEYIEKIKDISNSSISNVNIETNINTLYGYDLNNISDENLMNILNKFQELKYKSVIKSRTLLDSGFVFDIIYTPREDNDNVLFLLEKEYNTIEESEKDPEFPEMLKPFIIKEVTNDSNYSNYNLAR